MKSASPTGRSRPGAWTIASMAALLLTGAAVARADGPLVPEVTEVAPVHVEKRGHVLFVDFGKDAFGGLKIAFAGEPASGEWKVRLGEKLGADGAIDRHPPGSVVFREFPLPIQAGQRLYQLQIPPRKAPARSTSSAGEVLPFRYVEIENASAAPDGITATQLFVHAPFDDSASAFESSDSTLNAVWDLCKHTMKAATAFGVFIDGERERTPYEGDTYIAMLSQYACDLDPRVARATFEYLLKHPTWPTEWSLMMPMIAEADYEATGDPALADRNWAALRGKLMMNKARPDGLLEVSGIVDWPASERDGYNGGIGDPMQRQQVGPRVNTVVNAYYYDALQCMARLARALNKDDEAQDFETRAAKVADAFNATFFDAAHGNYRDGEGSNHTSLHANMFPMAFGLVPPEHAASVADFVQGRGMACSVFGAQFLLEALYGAGRSDAALALLTSYGETSWAHMMDLGSTMTLEAWDPSIKPNLTWNHAWGAAPANIIARYLLGVRPLTPGYKSILIAPQPGSLKWMRGKVPIPHGAVTVVWQNTPASLQITVPLETTARVELPREGGWQKTVSVNGQPIVPKLQNGTQILEPFPPGSYLIR